MSRGKPKRGGCPAPSQQSILGRFFAEKKSRNLPARKNPIFEEAKPPKPWEPAQRYSGGRGAPPRLCPPLHAAVPDRTAFSSQPYWLTSPVSSPPPLCVGLSVPEPPSIVFVPRRCVFEPRKRAWGGALDILLGTPTDRRGADDKHPPFFCRAYPGPLYFFPAWLSEKNASRFPSFPSPWWGGCSFSPPGGKLARGSVYESPWPILRAFPVGGEINLPKLQAPAVFCPTQPSFGASRARPFLRGVGGAKFSGAFPPVGVACIPEKALNC